MERILNVFLVDDHNLFREGLKFILEQDKNIRISGEASNAYEFLNKLKEKLPDIVLMDISMPGLSGIEATSEALKISSGLKIIALTMCGEYHYYFDMYQAGAVGFVLKESGAEELIKAIHSVANGNYYFSGRIMQYIKMHYPAPANMQIQKTRKMIELSDRENQILKMISKGLSNKEIAEKISLSKRTVEGIRSGLLNKTGTTNSLKLVLFAFQNDLLVE